MTETHDVQTFLDQAQVAPEIFKLRPDYRALLIVAEGITPGPSDEISETFLKEAEQSASKDLAQHNSNVLGIPHVAAWREAYKAFGAKPQRTRNSLEALTRRVESGLPRVNRITDIYNGMSIKYQIPLGGEDFTKYSSSPQLVRATGEEKFEAVSKGEAVVEHPDVGEVVWCDDAGVTCRRWNWRQCHRTALTEETSAALFIFDALEPISNETLKAAADELVSVLKGFSPKIQVARRVIGPSEKQQ